MKKFLLIFLLSCSCFINAQISDLNNLASGTIEIFSPLKDIDESFYGYFLLTKLDKVDKKNEKYEYLILDKNLNKVSNGEYIDFKYKNFNSYFYTPEKVNDKIVISKENKKILKTNTSYKKVQKTKFTSHKILDLETNKVSKSFMYANDEIVDLDSDDIKEVVKVLKKQKTKHYPLKITDGFIMFEKTKYANKGLKDVNAIQAYSMDKTLKWKYQFKDDNTLTHYSVIIKDASNVYLTTFNTKNKEKNIHCINQQTGELLFKYTFENKKSDYSHSYDIYTPNDNETTIIGKMSKYKTSGYDYDKALGWYRIVLDEKGNEKSKKYFEWKDAQGILDIKDNGKLDKGYKLSTKQYFVFKDGSFSVLNEKRKQTYNFMANGQTVKTTDFIILNFDADFNLKSFDTIEKEKSKWTATDYLYSQKIDDGNGVAFFYADKKKEDGSRAKNWVLGIVTIKDGKVNNEQLPMSSKKHLIVPYIAKEGHVLLRELNFEDKDNPFDQIRLEKLNY